MAYRERQKISQMTPKTTNLAANDLLEVSELVSGTYQTKSITGQQIINAASGGTIDLQFVTDVGNTTTNDIIVNVTGDDLSTISDDTITVENTNDGSYAQLNSGGQLILKTDAQASVLRNLNVTNPGVILEFPDKATGSYTIATTSDLTSGYVPYTGATQDVDLDANKLSAESIYIEGTSGNGHLHLKHQNSDATASGQSTALWADTNGDIKWKNDGDYKTTLKTSDNTADRVYTFRDQTGTVALQEVEFNTQTVNYTLALSDAYKMIEVDNASARTITIPTNTAVTFPIGTQILISQYGAGQVTISPDTGVTLRSSGGKTKTAAQYAMATLIKRGTDEWYLAGDITT